MKFPPFTEEHEIFRKSVRDFCEKEIRPHVDEWEEKGIFPREIFTEMGKLGFLGIRYPEKYGGSGLDWWYTACFIEELPRCMCAGVPLSIMAHTDMATPIINVLGTEEQKQEFLVPAIKGEKIGAICITEPFAGSDVAGIRTTAKKDGGDYIINGSKTFITNGTRADFLMMAAKTKPEAGHAGISLFIFPTDTKGFTVTRKLNKLGNRSSDTAELSFEDCRIPKRYLLGEENQGFYYAMRNFQGERVVAALSSTAGAQLAFEETMKYIQQRELFGKPLSKFQVTRHKMAELATKIEAARALTYHVVNLINQGVECTKEVSMAKIFCAEVSQQVVDSCLQLHGGYGYMEEYYICRAYRDIRLMPIGGGATEVMKEIVGRLLGL